jgi:hypothetical protein
MAVFPLFLQRVSPWALPLWWASLLPSLLQEWLHQTDLISVLVWALPLWWALFLPSFLQEWLHQTDSISVSVLAFRALFSLELVPLSLELRQSLS